MDILILIGMAIGGLVALLFVLAMMFQAFYVKVPQGTALIVNDMGSKPKVKFTGGMVIPVIHKKEFMKISLITLEVDRRGRDGLICRDNMRADITVAFYLRVNEDQDSVLAVAKAVGAERASDKTAVNELFNAKFSEALKTAGKKFDFVRLFEDRIPFRDEIIDVIGDDLNGYKLEDVAIDYLEQTPKGSLDANNIMDSEGIRKITELTASQNILTNEFERNEELAITKKNVETKEAMLALERQQADAQAKQEREIANIQAREEAEIKRVDEEERQKGEQARIKTQQELDIQEENKMREVEVAQQNRQRAVAIEVEKVTRAKDLEIVSREREVELQRIDKERALEEERTVIANVIRERVAVEKTVAQEEERIKEVRQVSEADRSKQVVVLNAQAEAEEELVKQVKQAEADEVKSKHKAVEINNLAQANLEAAGKEADAMKRMAEGTEAERAAPGLADARVQEVKADALEKEGKAEAAVLASKMEAQAQGDEQIGLAQARVIEAQALAKEREGLAEAHVLEETLGAQAKGDEQIGLAKALTDKEIGLAKALSDREIGMAEADIIRERFKAEADGLVDKFKAMGTMSESAQNHEEFRMQLEKQFKEAMASIEANKEIASDQAQVISTGLSKANIDIVGGNGDFFNTFAKSLTLGKGIEGLINKSPVAQGILGKMMSLGDTKKVEEPKE